MNNLSIYIYTVVYSRAYLVLQAVLNCTPLFPIPPSWWEVEEDESMKGGGHLNMRAAALIPFLTISAKCNFLFPHESCLPDFRHTLLPFTHLT
jgi:hypothetical protein